MNTTTDTRHQLAETLAAAMCKAADLETQIIAAEQDHAGIVATVTLAVLSRKDENGKPYFANEEARKAGIAFALAEDGPHRESLAEVAELRKAKAYAEAEAASIRNSIRLTVAQLMSGIDRL